MNKFSVIKNSLAIGIIDRRGRMSENLIPERSCGQRGYADANVAGHGRWENLRI